MTHPRYIPLTLALLLGSTSAIAAVTAESRLAEMRAAGYSRVEVQTGLTQTKVEAIRGTEKLEVIYDTATGTVLKREVETVDADDDIAPGYSISRRSRDYVEVDELDDDDLANDDDDDDDESPDTSNPDDDRDDDGSIDDGDRDDDGSDNGDNGDSDSDGGDDGDGDSDSDGGDHGDSDSDGGDDGDSDGDSDGGDDGGDDGDDD